MFVCSEMSELLFECYCVPRVSYGIDALFSYSYNAAAAAAGCRGNVDDALVVSCGYQATHIIPVLSGRLCAAASQRINVGGATIDAFMQRVLQLKYPQHFAAVTLNRAEVSSCHCCRSSSHGGYFIVVILNRACCLINFSMLCI